MSQFETTHQIRKPGDPDYISVEDSVRRHLEFLQQPQVRRFYAAKRAAEERRKASREAQRKRPVKVPNTDYPWLKSGWEW